MNTTVHKNALSGTADNSISKLGCADQPIWCTESEAFASRCNQRCPYENRVGIALICVFILGSGPTAQAATIFSQTTPEEPFSAYASHNSFEPPQYIADSFSFEAPSPKTVRSLRFIGGSGDVGDLPDDFHVVFLNDAGGHPGMPLQGGDYVIGSASNRFPTGAQLLGGITTPQEYVINLPVGITLSPNTVYWLSISNDLSAVSGWVWARAFGDFDRAIASTEGTIEGGAWKIHEVEGMWFELYDVNVPEPSTFTLLAMAAIAPIMIRRGIAPKAAPTAWCLGRYIGIQTQAFVSKGRQDVKRQAPS